MAGSLHSSRLLFVLPLQTWQKTRSESITSGTLKCITFLLSSCQFTLSASPTKHHFPCYSSLSIYCIIIIYHCYLLSLCATIVCKLPCRDFVTGCRILRPATRQKHTIADTLSTGRLCAGLKAEHSRTAWASSRWQTHTRCAVTFDETKHFAGAVMKQWKAT